MRITRFHLALGAVQAASLAFAAAADSFDAARAVLESHCLACHHPEKSKGELLFDTRENLLKGGESGAAAVPGNPGKSLMLERATLPADHDDLMPPKDGPLAAADLDSLTRWIADGLPWTPGVVLKPRSANDLPPWDAAPDPAITAIEAFPKSVTLETAADFHRVIILARFADASVRDITNLARLSLPNNDVARLTGNTLLPVADGTTTLTLDYRGRTTTVPVTVRSATAARPISFRLDVMPVITAGGCNSGACHGSARGQDGFRLSLFGFDPVGDHHRLTREMTGRRINLAIPEESLLLTKATGEVPHTGGKIFPTDSPAYHTLLEWIRAGAPDDSPDIARPTAITIEPSQFVLMGQDKRIPFSVRATYSDGTDRDVTTLSKFSTSNDNSATLEEHAPVAISKNHGEAFIMARFHTFSEGSQAIVIPDHLTYQRPEIPANNYIDSLVHDKLHKLRVIPSDLCDDQTFLRRAFLDILGALPTLPERDAFLADPSSNKRAALVDRLIADPRFTEVWTMKWSELLQIRVFNEGNNQVTYKAALRYHEWLKERVARNQPFDQTVRELLTARGGTFDNPATNFFQVEGDTLKLTENIAQVFMGTRIQCAQCHNHPFDRWTMDDYYGFTAFFAQVQRKRAEDPREQIVFDGSGEVKHPVTKADAKPVFLGGGQPNLTDSSRREAVAAWLTADTNPWFARNVSNIVWAHFFGIGIVNPVDDVRVSNPATNPELLDALAAKFISYKYDFRNLVRDICNSRTYQLSTRTNETNATDLTNFSHALVRRIRAEVLLDAISQVTATPNKFKGLPLGSRAVQIADGNTSNYFLTTFGRATRATVCACEVSLEPNLSQALHLINGDTTHERIKQGKVVEKLLAAKRTPAEIITQLYLTTLLREPTEAELSHLVAATEEGSDAAAQRLILEDIMWALLNSKEFIFNH
jgi:hypothetical protein